MNDEKNTLKIKPNGTIVLFSISPGMDQKYILDAFRKAKIPDECIFTNGKISSSFYGSKVSTLYDDGNLIKASRKLTNKSLEVAGLAIADLRSEEGLLTVIIDMNSGNDKTRRKYKEIAEENGVDFKLVVGKATHEDAMKSAMANNELMALFDDKYRRYTEESEFETFKLTRDFNVEVEYNHINEEEKIDVIGDVHGMYDDLKKLLIGKGYNVDETGISHPQGRKPVFIGDLTDRGKKSIEVLNLVKNTVESNNGYLVRGNHEQMLIDGFMMKDEVGGIVPSSISSGDTIAQILRLKKDEQEGIISFLKSTPTYLIYGETLIVHGNIESFNPASTPDQHLMNGDENHRNVDSDGSYQKIRDIKRKNPSILNGVNDYYVIRGHCRDTSINNDIVSVDFGASSGGALGITDLYRATQLMKMKGMTFRESVLSSTTKIENKYNHKYQKQEEKQLYKDLKELENLNLIETEFDTEQNITLFKATSKVWQEKGFFSHPNLNRATGICLGIDGKVVINSQEFMGNIGDDVPFYKNEQDVLIAEEPRGFVINVARSPYKEGLMFTTQNSINSSLSKWAKESFEEIGMYDSLNEFLGEYNLTLTFKVMHKDHRGARLSQEEYDKGIKTPPVLINGKLNDPKRYGTTLSSLQLKSITKSINDKNTNMQDEKIKCLDFKKVKFSEALEMMNEVSSNYYVRSIEKDSKNNENDTTYKLRSIPQLIKRITGTLTSKYIDDIISSKGQILHKEPYVYRLAIKNLIKNNGVEKMKTISKQERGELAYREVKKAYWTSIKNGMDLTKKKFAEDIEREIENKKKRYKEFQENKNKKITKSKGLSI